MSGIHVTNGARIVPFEDIDLDMDWTGAACRGQDPELWFPEPHRNHRIDWEPARAICARCPIRDRCLDYAMAHETVIERSHRAGMYGGKTPAERSQLAREQRRAEG